ncbi:ARID DNA-binding domain-containing protein, partial [Lentinula raphanica]
MRQYNFPINDSSTNGAPGPSNLGPTIPIFNTPIPPLDKQRFDATYKQWCQSKHILHDPRILTFENRPIDLYLLHCLVIREGGTANVTRNDLWPIIGGQLGIINFPGEPPRSGPNATMHIQNVYKEYLMAFDSVYTTSVMN